MRSMLMPAFAGPLETLAAPVVRERMNGSLAIRLFAVAAVVAGVLPPGSAARADDGVDAVLRASGAALGIGALPKIHTLRLRGAVELVGVKGTGDACKTCATAGTRSSPMPGRSAERKATTARASGTGTPAASCGTTAARARATVRSTKPT